MQIRQPVRGYYGKLPEETTESRGAKEKPAAAWIYPHGSTGLRVCHLILPARKIWKRIVSGDILLCSSPKHKLGNAILEKYLHSVCPHNRHN
jgi:hypothetical protein